MRVNSGRDDLSALALPHGALWRGIMNFSAIIVTFPTSALAHRGLENVDKLNSMGRKTYLSYTFFPFRRSTGANLLCSTIVMLTSFLSTMERRENMVLRSFSGGSWRSLYRIKSCSHVSRFGHNVMLCVVCGLNMRLAPFLFLIGLS